MKIAIVDVAAESGGALSIFTDFINFISKYTEAANHEWYIFTSVLDIEEQNNIHLIKNSNVKKSWLHRMYWERFVFKKAAKRLGIELIFSLQNNSLPVKGIKQIVYFHNILLLADKSKYSFFKSEERLYAIYTRIIAPYTLHTLKKCDFVITQTETAKSALAKKNDLLNIVVIKPNVKLEKITSCEGNKKIKGLFYPAAPILFKRHLDIVEAVKNNKLLCNNPEFEIIFTFRGDENSYASLVKERAKEIKNIKFVGFLPREKVLELYNSYGLIITSELESYPIPFIEAMYYGTPIVTYDNEYALEIVDKYPYAHICKKDIESLQNAMIDSIGEHIDSKINYNCNGNSWLNLFRYI